MNLLDFPPELLTLVFRNLDLQSLLRCTQVCRRMNSILEGSAFLQYRTKLVVTGKIDNPSCGLSLSARLKQLELYQDAWYHMRWSNVKLSYPVFNVPLWELVGGVLALYNRVQNAFRFVQLPSIPRGVPHREWQWDAFIEVGQGDFTIDPSADLLVIIERVLSDTEISRFKIRPLSLTTGKTHPKAQSSEIQIQLIENGPVWSYDFVAVFRNHLAILFAMELEKTELVILRWDTGKTVRHFERVMTYAVLTDTLIVVNCIGFENDEVSLDILDIYGKSYSRFLLPQPAQGYTFFDMQLISEGLGVLHSPELRNVPFTTSSEDRLLVINYSLKDAKEQILDYAFFVPISVLLGQHHRRQPWLEQDSIPWTEWGPSGTRAMPISFSVDWVYYVHGMKASVYEPTRKLFKIFDLSQMTIAYDLQKGTKPTTQYLTASTTIESVFAEPVSTCLPICWRTGTLPLEFVEAVMLTQDALLAVTGNDSDDDEMLHVYCV
ncbi:hypothetical protein EV361DRAFT_888306 [Lentinula raphanica]|nr:hypothetical protein EV361DRAFT_888306 [Lentinula raphanica]